MKVERSLPTSEEIGRRLRIVAELRNLCLSLGRARRMEPSDLPSPAAPEDENAMPAGDALSVPS